jgi:putative ABC transport system permease protein
LHRLDARIRAIPGIDAVGFAANGILVGSRSRSVIFSRGDDAKVRAGEYQQDQVSDGYFAAVGMTLLRGRTFTSGDSEQAPLVSVVTESFARGIYGTPDAIGRRFGFGAVPGGKDFTIVGVVADASVNAVRENAPSMFFIPVLQGGANASRYSNFLAVRTRAQPEIVGRMLREMLSREEPALEWGPWKTLRERMAEDVSRDVALSWMVGALAVVAMMLATLGIGVTLAHLVALHQREIAVRMALGADHRKIMHDVLAGAWRIAGIGGGVGLMLAWILPRVPIVASILPSRPDGWAAGVALVLGLIAVTIGGWRPARRAATVNPQQLLKTE